jgi:hypothetical protein
MTSTATVGKTSQITLRSLTFTLGLPNLGLNEEVGAVMFVLVTAPTPFLIYSSYS